MTDLPQLKRADADFVTERLAVGGGLSADAATARRQLDELVAAGITHIADLRIEWSDEEFVAEQAPRLHYFHHPVDDAGQVISPEYFEELAVWARAALSDPGAKILVHCHAGVNRGPSGAFAILLDQGWDALAALRAIRSARPIAWIDYANDALAWRHPGENAAEQLQAALDAVAHWRWDNGLSFNQAIRLRREPDT